MIAINISIAETKIHLYGGALAERHQPMTTDAV
jgi:hypothetical protein